MNDNKLLKLLEETDFGDVPLRALAAMSAAADRIRELIAKQTKAEAEVKRLIAERDRYRTVLEAAVFGGKP